MLKRWKVFCYRLALRACKYKEEIAKGAAGDGCTLTYSDRQKLREFDYFHICGAGKRVSQANDMNDKAKAKSMTSGHCDLGHLSVLTLGIPYRT